MYAYVRRITSINIIRLFIDRSFIFAAYSSIFTVVLLPTNPAVARISICPQCCISFIRRLSIAFFLLSSRVHFCGNMKEWRWFSHVLYFSLSISFSHWSNHREIFVFGSDRLQKCDKFHGTSGVIFTNYFTRSEFHLPHKSPSRYRLSLSLQDSRLSRSWRRVSWEIALPSRFNSLSHRHPPLDVTLKWRASMYDLVFKITIK